MLKNYNHKNYLNLFSQLAGDDEKLSDLLLEKDILVYKGGYLEPRSIILYLAYNNKDSKFTFIEKPGFHYPSSVENIPLYDFKKLENIYFITPIYINKNTIPYNLIMNNVTEIYGKYNPYKFIKNNSVDYTKLIYKIKKEILKKVSDIDEVIYSNNESLIYNLVKNRDLDPSYLSDKFKINIMNNSFLDKEQVIEIYDLYYNHIFHNYKEIKASTIINIVKLGFEEIMDAIFYNINYLIENKDSIENILIDLELLTNKLFEITTFESLKDNFKEDFYFKYKTVFINLLDNGLFTFKNYKELKEIKQIDLNGYQNKFILEVNSLYYASSFNGFFDNVYINSIENMLFEDYDYIDFLKDCNVYINKNDINNANLILETILKTNLKEFKADKYKKLLSLINSKNIKVSYKTPKIKMVDKFNICKLK